jgi:hypothetical protein
VLNCQIFFIGYLQFMERKYLHAELCTFGYWVLTVAMKLHRWLSVSSIAAPVKNGSFKPSGSFQGDGRDV